MPLTMKNIVYPVLILSLLFNACSKNAGNQTDDPGQDPPEEADTQYTNPVFEPVLADPSVVRDPQSGYFYAYGTEDDFGDGQGNRLIPILRSDDLVNWTDIGNAFEVKPDWKSSGWLWAPDVNYINNQYYLYYAYSTWGDSNPGIGLAISDDPAGPFIDQGKLFDSNDANVPNSIDPFYFEEDGEKYLFWGSFSDAATQGTYGVRLSDNGSAIPDLDAKFKIAAGDFEAVSIQKQGDYYYFFGSKGSCCEGVNSQYHVLVARSTNLNGPYLDRNGDDIRERGKGTLFLQGGNEFVGPGHNSRLITDDEGKDWLVYHAIDRSNGTLPGGASRRVLMIDPIDWVDGWPRIEGAVPSASPKARPVFD